MEKELLPEGKWYDFFTGKEYRGRQRFTIHADWQEIPVFVRDGGVIPIAEPVQCVREDTVFEIRVQAYGEKPGEFTLYEDDFVSWQYETKGFREVQIEKEKDGSVLVKGIEDCKKYRLVTE